MWCVGMHGKLKECAEAATVKKIMSMKGEDRGIEKEKVILKKRQLQKKKKGEIAIRITCWMFHIIPNTAYRKVP